MARISIMEEVLQRSRGAVGTDIPFIPGYTTNTDAELDIPILCTTVREFEEKFGVAPADVKGAPNNFDASYVMAKELLKAGMPVYYYALAVSSSNHKIDHILNNISIEDYTVSSNALTIEKTKLSDGIDPLVLNFSKELKAGDKITVIVNDPRITVAINDANKFDDDGTVTATKADSVNITLTYKDTTPASKDTALHLTFDVAVNIAEANIPSASDLDISDALTEIADKGEYTVKYITSGGYSNYSSTADTWKKMLEAAADRGDAIAFIEPDFDENVNFETLYNSIKTSVSEVTDTDTSYAASFAYWGEYNLQAKYGDSKLETAVLPGCFAYLISLAYALKTTPNWHAIAGVSRGLVPNLKSLKCKERLSNALADKFQPMYSAAGTATYAINAITNITPYGLTIWGNRTLHPIDNADDADLNPLCFLNTRSMLCDIKKLSFRVAKELMYEQNTDLVWLKFKSRVTPYLDQLKSGSGIYDYKLVRLDTTSNPKRPLLKHEFACAIKVQPIRALEAFDITIVVSDNDVNVD